MKLPTERPLLIASNNQAQFKLFCETNELAAADVRNLMLYSDGYGWSHELAVVLLPGYALNNNVYDVVRQLRKRGHREIQMTEREVLQPHDRPH